MHTYMYIYIYNVYVCSMGRSVCACSCCDACVRTGTLYMCKCTCVCGGQSFLVDYFLPYIWKQGLSLHPQLAHLVILASLLILWMLCLCPLGWITSGPSHISGIYMGARYSDSGLHICRASKLSLELPPLDWYYFIECPHCYMRSHYFGLHLNDFLFFNIYIIHINKDIFITAIMNRYLCVKSNKVYNFKELIMNYWIWASE